MKKVFSFCLFTTLLILNSHKAKCEGYKPETPEEAALYAIANKNILPNDINENNIEKYKEKEICWIGKIAGYMEITDYAPNIDKEALLFIFDYYAYNWHETGKQDIFLLQQGGEMSEFMAIYIPENINTFIDDFLGEAIEFVIIYGKVAAVRGYISSEDELDHRCVFIEVDYIRILKNDLIEIVPFETGEKEVLQENVATQEEEPVAETELSGNNEANNLPQDEGSTIDKQRVLIIVVISLLAIIGICVMVARRHRVYRRGNLPPL